MIKLRKTNLLNFFLILAALGCTREKQSNRLFQSYSTLTCEQLLETKKNLAATDARFQKMYFEPLQFLVAELNKVSQPLPGLRQCYRQHLELLLASKSVQQTSDQFSQEQKLQLSKAIVLVVDAISVTNRQGPFHSFEQILTNEKTYEDFARLSVPLKLDAFKNLLQTYPQFAESPLLTQLSHHIIEFNELSIYEPYSGIKELVTRSNVTSSPNVQVAMLRLVTLTLVRNGFLFTERGRLQGIKKLERIMKSTEQNLRNAPANSQAASTAALMLANFKKIRENVLNSTYSFARLENELKAAYVDLGVPNAAQLVTDALAEARLAVHEGLPYGVARIQEGDIWMQTSEGGLGDMLSSLAGTPNAFTHSGFVASEFIEGYRTYFIAEINGDLTFSNILFNHHVLVRPKFKVEPGFTAWALSNAAKLPGLYFDSMFTPGLVTAKGSGLLYCSELIHFVYKNRLAPNGPFYESPYDSLSNKIKWKTPALEENARKLGYATQMDFYTPDNLFYSPTTQFVSAYFYNSKYKEDENFSHLQVLMDLFDEEFLRLMQTRSIKRANALEMGAVDVALAGIGFANRIPSLRNMLPEEATSLINSLDLDNDSRHTLLKMYFTVQKLAQHMSQIIDSSDFTDPKWKEKAKARTEHEVLPKLRSLFE